MWSFTDVDCAAWVPKGFRQMLQEVGVDPKGIVREQLLAKLETFNDFKYELTAVVNSFIRGTAMCLPH